jgi:alanine racemase
VDTGLSRGGSTSTAWPVLVAAAREAEVAELITVTGIWSHFACSDQPDHPANDLQERNFRAALDIAERVGLRPEVRHLANSAAAILRPSARFDLVRCGIASYGLTPAPGLTDHVALAPAMTVRAELAVAKQICKGDGVSYGHTWIADHDTTVGVVPAGYGDGIPRHASNTADVWIDGRRRPVRGRICMDQFVVDLDGDDIRPGAAVVLFGSGDGGEPTAQDWAEACGTINYEIVTRIGGRLRRRYHDSHEGMAEGVAG